MTGTVFLLDGLHAALWSILVGEAVVFLLESFVYARWLQGYTARRRIVYALTANAASALAGFFALFLTGGW